MSPIHGRMLLVLVALASIAGCGGSLGGQAAPDGDIVAQCSTPIPVQSLPGTPCSYPIPTPPCDVVDRAHIGVVVYGVQILHDTSHANGWDYTDSNYLTIDIYGPSCDAIMTGTPANVSIMFRIYGIAALWRPGGSV